MKFSTKITKALEFIIKILNTKKNSIQEKQVEIFVNKVDFHPFLQPIFNSSGDKMVGCEVLLRVKTDEGFTSPASYINFLECSHQMNYITSKLLKDVSDYFLAYVNDIPNKFYFSFNIYPEQLHSEEIIQELIIFSDKFKGKASLVLEIVERGTLQLNEETSNIMNTLIRKGIRFAIDDFGAGTSSLKYIEHIGFSTIKIDRELTQTSDNRLINNKTIEAIVTLSIPLGFTVTAEGVENELQLDLLKKAGVNAMQGYYLAKPMEMKKFVNLYLQYK
ncbi:EAL domain-containing protein [Enterobacter sp. UPMP2060]